MLAKGRRKERRKVAPKRTASETVSEGEVSSDNTMKTES